MKSLLETRKISLRFSVATPQNNGARARKPPETITASKSTTPRYPSSRRGQGARKEQRREARAIYTRGRENALFPTLARKTHRHFGPAESHSGNCETSGRSFHPSFTTPIHPFTSSISFTVLHFAHGPRSLFSSSSPTLFVYRPTLVARAVWCSLRSITRP